MRHSLAALLCLLLAGCGSGAAGGGQGSASLWITRDAGTTVLYEGEVAPGQTVLQALRSRADVETAYGGRFVEEIDGLRGSLASGRDWFYFVNGVAPDRGAAEVRLRDGDIAWWDYRRWSGEGEVQIVVGAFPEPLVNGYGERRDTVVRYRGPAQREGAEAIGRLVEARSVEPQDTPVPPGANVFVVAEGPDRFVAEAGSPAGPYRLTFSGDAEALARDPARYRFRVRVP
ncbi:MAG: DUF4430 domain-containing protein [Thermoleophilia bacterium]|nr:DUF4430 domain-containing protein [Thermoleophilia bacterium]